MPSPSVTIAVVPRERFSHAKHSLESVYKNTDYPFELVYVDGNSPPPVKRYLEEAAARHRFKLIRRDEYLSPNQARNVGLKEVRTKYVVFLDNDVEVQPGWLAHLVSCAEETGAWAVSPLYFEGKTKDRIIHTAGGVVEFVDDNGTRTPRVIHSLHAESYDAVAPTLRREPTGFFEYHCVLLPLDTFTKLGPLDEACLSLHEHTDLSLMIRQAGGAVYLEPEAHVTYVQGMLRTSDLEYACLRWSDDWNRRSTVHFLRKWKADEDSAWATSVIDFGRRHREHLVNMRRSPTRVLKIVAKNVLPTRAYTALHGLHQ